MFHDHRGPTFHRISSVRHDLNAAEASCNNRLQARGRLPPCAVPEDKLPMVATMANPKRAACTGER
jgi:hypothetical protein